MRKAQLDFLRRRIPLLRSRVRGVDFLRVFQESPWKRAVIILVLAIELISVGGPIKPAFGVYLAFGGNYGAFGAHADIASGSLASSGVHYYSESGGPLNETTELSGVKASSVDSTVSNSVHVSNGETFAGRGEMWSSATIFGTCSLGGTNPDPGNLTGCVQFQWNVTGSWDVSTDKCYANNDPANPPNPCLDAEIEFDSEAGVGVPLFGCAPPGCNNVEYLAQRFFLQVDDVLCISCGDKVDLSSTFGFPTPGYPPLTLRSGDTIVWWLALSTLATSGYPADSGHFAKAGVNLNGVVTPFSTDPNVTFGSGAATICRSKPGWPPDPVSIEPLSSFHQLRNDARYRDHLTQAEIADPSLGQRFDDGSVPQPFFTSEQQEPGGLWDRVNALGQLVLQNQGSFGITSAFRPLLYQAHLYDIMTKATKLEDLIVKSPSRAQDPACDSLRQAINAEVKNHGLVGAGVSPAPPSRAVLIAAGVVLRVPDPVAYPIGAPHVRGVASDLTFSFPPGKTVDIGKLADQVGLYRPQPIKDPVHFELKPITPANLGTSFVLESPVNMMVRDPQGRQVGFDPSTGLGVNDLGSDLAYYSGPDTHPQRVDIFNSTEGIFTVSGVGTGNDTFTLTFRTFSPDGLLVNTRSTTGVAVSGNRITPVSFILDATPPTIIAPPDIQLSASPTDDEARLASLGNPVVSDNLDTSILVSNDSPTDLVFPVGTTIVTWTATDSSDNYARATQLVVVMDITPPSIQVPNNVSVVSTSDRGTTVTYEAQARDNVDGQLSPICEPPSGSVFPVGVTEVSCSSTDTAGNQANASFTITVVKSSTILGLSPIQFYGTTAGAVLAGILLVFRQRKRRSLRTN